MNKRGTKIFGQNTNLNQTKKKKKSEQFLLENVRKFHEIRESVENGDPQTKQTYNQVLELRSCFKESMLNNYFENSITESLSGMLDTASNWKMFLFFFFFCSF